MIQTTSQTRSYCAIVTPEILLIRIPVGNTAKIGLHKAPIEKLYKAPREKALLKPLLRRVLQIPHTEGALYTNSCTHFSVFLQIWGASQSPYTDGTLQSTYGICEAPRDSFCIGASYIQTHISFFFPTDMGVLH